MKYKTISYVFFLIATLFSNAPVNAAQPNSKVLTKSDSITGHYREKVSGNTLDVKLLPGNKIKIDLNAFYPCADPDIKNFPGGPNMGETSATFPIKNGVAVYSTTEFDGKCKLTFTFGPGKITVAEDEETMCACGYGMNVRADGIYKKLNNRPKFQ